MKNQGRYTCKYPSRMGSDYCKSVGCEQCIENYYTEIDKARTELINSCNEEINTVKNCKSETSPKQKDECICTLLQGSDYCKRTECTECKDNYQAELEKFVVSVSVPYRGGFNYEE